MAAVHPTAAPPTPTYFYEDYLIYARAKDLGHQQVLNGRLSTCYHHLSSTLRQSSTTVALLFGHYDYEIDSAIVLMVSHCVSNGEAQL